MGFDWFCPSGPPVKFGYLSDDAQSEATTPGSAGFICTVKTVKQPRKVGRGNSRAIVFDA
jgi:hypothetical protein